MALATLVDVLNGETTGTSGEKTREEDMRMRSRDTKIEMEGLIIVGVVVLLSELHLQEYSSNNRLYKN